MQTAGGEKPFHQFFGDYIVSVCTTIEIQLHPELRKHFTKMYYSSKREIGLVCLTLLILLPWLM